MFPKDELADQIFDDFMTNRPCQGATFADFVVLLNMKAAQCIDNRDKMDLITEILNDLKLFTLPTTTDKAH